MSTPITQCLLYAVLFLILLTIPIQTNSYYTAQLQSFGVIVQNLLIDTNNHSEILLHLNWATNTYHCKLSIYNNNNNSTHYLCFINNISTTTCNYTNYVSYNGLQSITISINSIKTLIIDKIIINMDDNSYYMIDSFCVDDEYQDIGYNEIHSTNCTDFNQQNEYEYINHNITIPITIYFIDNIGLIKIASPLNMHCEEIKIESFGFHAYDTIDSPHDDNVTLTLYWFDQILQCIIIKPFGPYGSGRNEDFICNKTDITLIGTNIDTKEYKIKLQYDHKWALFVSSIIVFDLFGNRYNINNFCGPQQFDYIEFWRTISNDGLCHSNYDQNIYRYAHIGMDNDEALCTQIYLNFDENMLSNPDNDISARISLPKITEFGIHTIIAPKYTVHLRLYWDIYLYLCSLHIIDSNRLYLCNVSNTTQVISNCSDPKIASYESQFAMTIELDPNNGFQIDYIYIKDEADSIYKIEQFCQPLLNGDDPSIIEKCTDFNEFYRYHVVSICHEKNPCNSISNNAMNSLLTLQFPFNLLHSTTKYDISQNEYVFQSYTNFISIYSSRAELSCNLSVSSSPTPESILNASTPTPIITDNTTITINIVEKHYPNDREDNLFKLLIPILLFVTMGCCGAALIGCCYYNRSLRKQLKLQNTDNTNTDNTDELEQKVDGNENADKLSGLTPIDLTNIPRTLSKLTTKSMSRTRSGLILKDSVHSSLIDAFKKSSTQNILPPGQPKKNKNNIPGDGPNDDEEEEDDLSIHTASSQKEEEKNNNLYINEHMEGYMEETKLESVVHLEVIKAGYDNDNDQDESRLLDGIMVDVLKQESLDPNKRYNRTYSDDSDDMYQKPESDDDDDNNDDDNNDDEKDDIDYQYETQKTATGHGGNQSENDESDQSEPP